MRQTMNSSCRFLLILVLALLAAACAKSNVRTTQEVAYTGLPRPDRVMVYNFAVSPSEVKTNSSFFAKIGRAVSDSNQTAEEIELGREVADALTTELVEKISNFGLNAIRADSLNTITGNAVLVTGNFIKIDEGNRLRRNAIGFGMGQASIDAEVSVMAPGRSGLEQIIGFEAHADSGNMPGAAVLGPAGAAAGAGTAAVVTTNAVATGVKSYRSDSAQQAKQIADKIAKELAKYFAQQGWIDPSLAE